MKIYPKLFLLALLSGTLVNCEDPIDLESRFEGPQLVVDAWITNAPDTQRIHLTESQDFYANRLPTGVTDAQVGVCPTEGELADCRIFSHVGNGTYEWVPAPGDSLGPIGTEYALGIQRGERNYGSVTTLRRTATIDSISFQFEEEALGLDEGFYAQLYARDPVGEGDAYWIRSTINDTMLLRPFEINLAYDAVFDPGTGADGITFIFPIRFGINRIDDDGSPVAIEEGDKVEVEIWSLSQEAYLFLTIASEQIANGESGIFGLPVANSPGNVVDTDSGEPVLGFFNVAASARATRTRE